MIDEMKKIIHNYILLPLAIKVLKHDREHFKDFKMRDVYLGKLDSCIMHLQEDIIFTKKQVFTKYHLNIKQISSVSYRWESRNNSGEINYTPDQLKSMTENIVRQYLYGEKSTDFEVKNRGWL